MVIVASDLPSCCDLDLGGLSLASLATIHNLLGHGLHVDRCLLFPPSWLQSFANDPLGCCDLDLGGLSLAFLAVACDPPSCSPHVDCHFPFPPSWL